jgi:hypothetical protein
MREKKKSSPAEGEFLFEIDEQALEETVCAQNHPPRPARLHDSPRRYP